MQEIHSLTELKSHIDNKKSLRNTVLQGLNLEQAIQQLETLELSDTVFLGCKLPAESYALLQQKGAVIFPSLNALPYEPCRPQLYSVEDLFNQFDPQNPCTYCDSFDGQVYKHWQETGRAEPSTIMETLARRLHDHAMTDAIHDFLESFENTPKLVAIMGGHSMKRDDSDYAKMAYLARSLSQEGYMMLSGGGPGAMEAAHLGAYFAHFKEDALEDALKILAEAPYYQDKYWLSKAFEVRAKYPLETLEYPNLAIPTWLYGHEPPNAFASHIAKYFANSVREEGLVSLAKHGIVFAPGSAGTIQEIFQDATQNHYVSLGEISPMVFFNKDYWIKEKPVYPLLKQLAQGYAYDDYLTIIDSLEETIAFIKAHPPKAIAGKNWSFCEAHC